MAEHNTVARHDAAWVFFTDIQRVALRGCTVCGEVEVVVITAEQRAAARGRPGGR